MRIFGKGKCKLIANCANFWQGKCKFIANFSATMVTSLPSLSVCLYLSLSLSPKVPHAHDIGSASALPIMMHFSKICSVLGGFHPCCSGMCCFTWASARWRQLLFVVLAAGLWCFTAGCHVKSPLFRTQTPSQTKVCSTMGERIRPSFFLFYFSTVFTL